MLRSILKTVTAQTRAATVRFASSNSSFSRFDTEDYSISSDSDSNGSSSDDTNVNNIKRKILNASLPFVHQHGWSTKSLALGAEQVDLSKMTHGLFPQGGYELVSHFYKNCNDELEKKLIEINNDANLKPQTRDFIEDAIKFRLGLITPFVPKWSEAMVLMVKPQNLLDSFKNFSTMVDDIWYHAGDKSTDLNWYTKRGAVALVYKATELSLITDQSEGFEETWAFLRRRMDDVATVGKYSDRLSGVPNYLNAAFEVTKNILSYNNLKKR